MNCIKIISIDESGKASYNHLSKEFALVGIVIDEKYKVKLNNSLNKLKKKFLKNENIVLHYNEIVRKSGVFSCLRDNGVEEKFWCEVLSILNNPKIDYFFTLVDKEKAQKQSWLEKTVVQKSYSQLIKMFVCSFGKNDKGKIVTESDTFQDVFLAKAHNIFQSTGITECNLSGKSYSEKITSLSFVNKNNFDPEVQLADLLGSSIRLKYRLDYKKSKEKINSIEKKKIKLITRKIKKNSSNFIILL